MTATNTAEREALIEALGDIDLADLSKRQLVELTRRVCDGAVGDSARTTKEQYVARMQLADRSKVVEALTAMVDAGELEIELADDEAAQAADQAITRAADRAPAGAAGKLADALRELIGPMQAQAAPLDEGAVAHIAQRIADNTFAGRFADSAEALIATVNEHVTAKLADIKPVERVIVVDQAKGERREVTGHVHAAFDRVVKLASIRQNILLVGPSGCGKTKLAGQVAEALALPYSFISCSAGMSESQLQGWLLPVEAGGQFSYVPAPFVEAYEDGGVFMLDEMDAADENMLIVINAAIANGRMSLPQRREAPSARRHADFVLIAGANTYGHGADRVYAGRNQLDGATLDRFRAGIVPMAYCAKLEAAIVDADVLTWGLAIRERIDALRLRRVMSTRVLLDYSRQKAALGFGRVEWESSYFADWTRDELTKVGR